MLYQSKIARVLPNQPSSIDDGVTQVCRTMPSRLQPGSVQLMIRRVSVIVVGVWLLFGAAEPARASLILTMVQDPTGVVVAGSCVFDLTALTLNPGNAPSRALMFASASDIFVGALGFVDGNLYQGTISGPINFGPGGGPFLPTLGSGPRIGITSAGASFFLIVPSTTSPEARWLTRSTRTLARRTPALA